MGVCRKKVKAKFKIITLKKFPKKIMVWQAVCQCGLKTQSFVTNSTMNREIYQKECLKKRLLPLWNAYNSNAIFWPDLASSHYSKSTLNFYNANKISYLEHTILQIVLNFVRLTNIGRKFYRTKEIFLCVSVNFCGRL